VAKKEQPAVPIASTSPTNLPKVEAKTEVQKPATVEPKQAFQDVKKENVVAEKVEKEIKKEEPPKSSQQPPEKVISTSLDPYSSLSRVIIKMQQSSLNLFTRQKVAVLPLL